MSSPCKDCQRPSDFTVWGRCYECAAIAYKAEKWPYCRLILDVPTPPTAAAEQAPADR